MAGKSSNNSAVGSVMMPPEEADKWLARMEKLAEDSIKSIDDAAKSIMTACTFLIGIYALVMPTDKARLDMMKSNPGLYLVPVICFAVALLIGLVTLLPERYVLPATSVTRTKSTWLHVANDKFLLVWLSVGILLVGLVFLTGMYVSLLVQ